MLSGLHFLAPCIAASGGDIGGIIWPLIIFIVIAVRITTAMRSFAKNKPGSQRPVAAPQSSTPEDELKRFLEGLSNRPKEADEPPPPPAPVPVRPVMPSPAPPPITAPQAKIIITRHTPPPTPQVVAPPVPDAPVPVRLTTTVPQQATRPAGSGRRLSDIIGRLGNRHLLREAIILREVLGPSLGQRPRPPIA